MRPVCPDHAGHGQPSSAPPGLAALIPRIAARYAGASRFPRHYVASKLRRDPATAAIMTLAVRCGGFGGMVDLGCGLGQFSVALLQAGLATEAIGLDQDRRKLEEAGRAADQQLGEPALPARFQQVDLATSASLPDCDTMLAVDVLYQMPEAAQRRLLEAMALAARRRIVIRAFDPDLGWRSHMGFVMEFLNRSMRGDHGRSIRPLPLAGLATPLEAQGFRVTIAPCWAGTPLPNVLLHAERSN